MSAGKLQCLFTRLHYLEVSLKGKHIDKVFQIFHFMDLEPVYALSLILIV